MDKNILRSKMLEVRKKISDKHNKNSDIYYNFLKLFDSDFDVICAYNSFKSEASCDLIIDYLLKENKKVFLPISYENGNMEFKQYSKNTKIGLYGIKEPDLSTKLEISPDIVLVPGVCFDKNGYRIGYGKGYYDRFLSNTNAIKVGICFSEQIVEEIYHDVFDVSMDYIITNQEIIQMR